MDVEGHHLTGSRRVRAFQPAFSDCRRLITRRKCRMEVRRHALKLRYWPGPNPIDEAGQVLDLDWEWIKACKGLDIGELRIHERIEDCDNLRIIFYVGDPAVRYPLPLIWVLQVMQKKRQEFTRNDIETFKFRRLLVIKRFYESWPNVAW